MGTTARGGRLAESARWRGRLLRARLDACLAPLERAALRRAGAPSHPPVFILGAPRSGTTLVYQVFTVGLQVSYFLNLADAFPRSPGFVTALVCRVARPAPPPRFRSAYGETRGWSGPSHGRHIWRRWFPGDQSYVDAGRIAPAARDEMRGTLALVERAFGRPFVNKAQGHCGRVPALLEAFPQALFVRVTRGRLQTAESILRSRKEFWGDVSHWFSARPREYERIAGGEPCRQVCEQVFEIENDLRRDLGAVTGRVFELSYEEFCRAPRATLESFRGFYRRHAGLDPSPRRPVPESFRVSERRSASQDEIARLREHVARLWPGEPLH